MGSRHHTATGPAATVARGVGHLLWVFIPVLSLSLLSFVPATQIAWRARTAGWVTAAAVLALGSAVVLTGLATDAEGPGFGGVLILTTVGGVTAAAVGRKIAFAPPAKPEVDPALSTALQNRERRERAREIVASDPALALELRIGRPDIHGGYEDGGLVDLNNADATGIATALSWPLDATEAFIAMREARHGFGSLTEIGALSGLSPRLLESGSDRIVVLPYRGHGSTTPL